MTCELSIDQPAPEVVDEVTELWVRLAAGQREYDSAVEAEPNRETMQHVLAGHAAAGGLLTARLEGALVGFASVSLERGSLTLAEQRGVLSNLYVEPAVRTRGIGSALLEAAETRLAAMGATSVTLEVMAGNVDGRRFYRDHGYEPLRVTMTRSIADRAENDTSSKVDR